MTQSNLKYSYEEFAGSESSAQWQKIGLKRRAGVALALFSIYSHKSVGIGEFSDLRPFIDWCSSNHLSILQQLPLNDTGFDFRPYDAQSAFALEPVYLCLDELRGVPNPNAYHKEIEALRKKYPLQGRHYVNYEIKKDKLELLKKIFQDQEKFPQTFERFIQTQAYWLEGYVRFRVVSDHFQHGAWEYWPEAFQNPQSEAVAELTRQNPEMLQFYRWVQWQCFEALCEVKAYGAQKGVFILGDMPFLTSRHSACVWTYQRYFKLDLESGAPPDSDYVKGQRWGMPPYNWEAIEQDRFQYLSMKLKYAENFYHLYRIDHIVGVYRLWTIRREESRDLEGSVGAFDPPTEIVWEEHGYKLLRRMISSTGMLACGEDLGTVPHFSGNVLSCLGIPGMNIQRWNRDWGGSLDFSHPDTYRKNSVAMISTHDTSSFLGWWKCEVGTVNAKIFERTCEYSGLCFETLAPKLFDGTKSNAQQGRLAWKSDIDSVEKFLDLLAPGGKDVSQLIFLLRSSFFEKAQFLAFLGLEDKKGNPADCEVAEAALEKILEAASVFSIQLLQDWLALDPQIEMNPWDFRINFPGTVSSRNWAILFPLSIESLKARNLNSKIKVLVQQSGRA